MKIWHMRIASRVTKITNKHTVYVIRFALYLNKGYKIVSQCYELLYLRCLSSLFSESFKDTQYILFSITDI